MGWEERVWGGEGSSVDDFLLYGVGLFMLLSGFSKFLAPETWQVYMPLWFVSTVPASATSWMYVVGLVETSLGALTVFRWRSHVWTGLSALWLLSVTVAVLTAGRYDVAWRDLGLALWAAAASLNEYRRA
ncbi:MAG: hypothetical protein ABEJ62_01995 [Candidatus Nanohaloarchaea archaeon]